MILTVDNPKAPTIVRLVARDRLELSRDWIWSARAIEDAVPLSIRRAARRFLHEVPEETRSLVLQKTKTGWTLAAHSRDCAVGLVILDAKGHVLERPGASP